MEINKDQISNVYNALFKEYPDVVSVEQISEMLHISTKTVYKLLRENKIKYFMIGRIYKIPKINILYFLITMDNSVA